MLLDDDINEKNISVELLQEIVSNQKTYPKYFIEKAKEELSCRNVSIRIQESHPVFEKQPLNLKSWFLDHPMLLIFAIITMSSSFPIGALVVLFSCYVAMTCLNKTSQNRLWRYAALVLLLINVLTLIIFYVFFNYVF